ncbi:MAG: BON domain-containing protein [Phycisphaerales bacterium JB058]
MQNRHNAHPQNQDQGYNQPEFRRDFVEGQPNYYAQQAEGGPQNDAGGQQNQHHHQQYTQRDANQGQSGVPSRGYSSTGGQPGAYYGQGTYGPQPVDGSQQGYQQPQGSGGNQRQYPGQQYQQGNAPGAYTSSERQQTRDYGYQGQQGNQAGPQGFQDYRGNQNYNAAGQAGSARYGQSYTDSGYVGGMGQQGYPNPTGIGNAISQGQGRPPKAYKRSDERIQEDIYERLTHSGMDCSDIEVSVDSGEVNLKGEIDSRPCKFHAEQLADSVTGVKDVSNQLKVNRNRNNEDRESERRTQYDPNARYSRTNSETNIDIGESNQSNQKSGSKS